MHLDREFVVKIIVNRIKVFLATELSAKAGTKPRPAGSMVVDGTAQLLHLERPTLRRHPGAPLPEMGDEAEQIRGK